MPESPADPAPGYRVELRHYDSEGCPIEEHEAILDDLSETIWVPMADGLHGRFSKREATEATWEHFRNARGHGAPSDEQLKCARAVIDEAMRTLNQALKYVGAKHALSDVCDLLEQANHGAAAALVRAHSDKIVSDADR